MGGKDVLNLGMGLWCGLRHKIIPPFFLVLTLPFFQAHDRSISVDRPFSVTNQITTDEPVSPPPWSCPTPPYPGPWTNLLMRIFLCLQCPGCRSWLPRWTPLRCPIYPRVLPGVSKPVQRVGHHWRSQGRYLSTCVFTLVARLLILPSHHSAFLTCLR